MSSDQLKAEQVVDVAADRLFALLADPSRHIEFDTSTLMRGLAQGGPIGAVGDVFIMDMFIEQILEGPYQVRNEVIAFEPGRTIGWAPTLHPLDGYTDKLGTVQARGHSFTWTLEPASTGGTKVSLVYDWSGVEDPQYRAFFPLLSQEQLSASIAQLAKAAA